LMLGLHLIVPPYTRRCGAAFHSRMSGLLRDFVSFARLQMVSVVRNARITCRNSVLNLPAYLANPGVEVLEGRGRGRPAIIVAAGPSLVRNIDQLHDLRSRAVIIAVQTVLKTLLSRGIRPHFVTSLDYHEVSAQFFRGIEEFGDTALVAEPKVAWQVLRAFRGRTHVLRSAFLTDVLRDAAPERGALQAGSTVAHLAFYLAEHLGCDPIVLVGQDLSFSDGLYYPPGMQVESIWQPELGRFTTLEMKQWERIVRHRVTLRKVKDIHGRDVYTDDQMFTYAEQFQSDFLATRTRVIHATEGGMRLDGAEVMTLREAARQFCTQALPDDLFALPARSGADSRNAAIEQIERRLAELREMRAISEQTGSLLGELEQLIEQPAKFNRLVARVDGLHARIKRHDRTYNLVTSVSQLAELRRVQADRGIREDEPETPANTRRRLRRDRSYLAAFIDGCDFLLELLPQALAVLRGQEPGSGETSEEPV
ncbi:MAG: 6-hydroxymethylpterin diphosphokinase MptE-like protein, partial [Planctomycetota bacterium]